MAMAAIPEASKPDVVRSYEPTVFVRQLGSRVGDAMPRCGEEPLEPVMLQDLIVRLFTMYAMQGDFDFDRIEPALRRLTC